jgi:hypothetical protein
MSDEDFEAYLKSIGGLVNGYRTDRGPIISAGIASVGNGWLGMIKQLIEDLIKAGWNKEICQIKEKFGGLRFYINEGNEEVWKLISEAEKKSYQICETCGEPGEPENTGWIKTACTAHMKQRIEN